ncbi:phosphomannomutase/phosphoglucomutase [Sphingomonas sp. RHCKR47]|uniref:phosphoglucomutase/phosphomannomutase PgmG n=1 Tax=Sphingomonas citricola TaxID=2862498 RepID=UPI001CA4A35C|nr:phosphomannomutase/phosphoglucomutase [Sphingomonas citricola]MBW6524979.1 phosphomannomutase/phosphoglucomutase [Sphingomonas citricola]
MTHRFHPSILRDYDIRGTVGETLGEADAYAVGRSFATRVRRAGGHRVVVGRDGRLSSPMLEDALIDGLIASRVDVVRIGLGPSPMLYFAEATLGVDAGVQVTGSHNPAGDNGFKFVLAHESFFGDDVCDLARLAAAGDWESGLGEIRQAAVLDDYVARLVEGATDRPFRIGWDAANGAAGPVIERLTQILPGEHHLLYTDVDGTFPNHHPDPTIPANLSDLIALVTREGLDMGFAFDGDGDRIGAVDARGRIVWGDQLLALLAEPLLCDLPGACVVADVKSSDALFDRIRALGGRAVMAKSGHSQIKARMRQEGAAIGAELSGHIFFAYGYYGFDDAAYAAVRLMRAIDLAGCSLAELIDRLPATCASPELRIMVPEDRRLAIVDEVRARVLATGAEVDLTDGLRVSTPDGWWLLRASNTQAAVTVRAEAGDEAGLERLLDVIDRELARSSVSRG